MEAIIQKWSDIIKDLHLDQHPYKVAWGRALLDALRNEKYTKDDQGQITIYQEDIVDFAIEYFWNQVIYFALDQGHFEEGEALLHKMRRQVDCSHPVWFDDVKENLQEEFYFLNEIRKEWIKLFNKYASRSFMKSSSKHHDIYQFNRVKRKVVMHEKDVTVLLDYFDLLHPLINHQWGALLSKYNVSPNISKKVCQSCFEAEKRNNLRKYRNLLLEHFHFYGAKDFFTDEHLRYEDIGINYLIPYRYCYQDDLWNLVILHKDKIKEMEFHIPSQEEIKKLADRNKKLLESLQTQQSEFAKDLEFALSHNLAQKYYLDFVKNL